MSKARCSTYFATACCQCQSGVYLLSRYRHATVCLTLRVQLNDRDFTVQCSTFNKRYSIVTELDVRQFIPFRSYLQFSSSFSLFWALGGVWCIALARCKSLNNHSDHQTSASHFKLQIQIRLAFFYSSNHDHVLNTIGV